MELLLEKAALALVALGPQSVCSRFKVVALAQAPMHSPTSMVASVEQNFLARRGS
jgi:hypothetical protein